MTTTSSNSLLEELCELVDFSQPMMISTSRGTRYVRKAPVNAPFWDFYKVHKEALREIGVRASKFRDEWNVEQWSESASMDVTPTPSTTEPAPETPLPTLAFPDGILEYQTTSVQLGVRSMMDHKFVLLGHSTGVGKTFISLFIAREMGKRVFVVCPKTVATDWKRACAATGVDFVGIHGWEWVKLGKTPYGAMQKQERAQHFEWSLPDDCILILDEVHRGKSSGTLNSKLIRAAVNQSIPFMGLSATIAETPMNLQEIGRA